MFSDHILLVMDDACCASDTLEMKKLVQPHTWLQMRSNFRGSLSALANVSGFIQATVTRFPYKEKDLWTVHIDNSLLTHKHDLLTLICWLHQHHCLLDVPTVMLLLRNLRSESNATWWMVGISRGECELATHTCVKLELIMAIKWFVSNFKTLCQRHIFYGHVSISAT